MRKNVGSVDALIRLTCGLVGLSWSTAQFVRHPRRGFPTVVGLLSAMKVAEGVTRVCPTRTLWRMIKPWSEFKAQRERYDQYEAHTDYEGHSEYYDKH